MTKKKSTKKADVMKPMPYSPRATARVLRRVGKGAVQKISGGGYPSGTKGSQ